MIFLFNYSTLINLKKKKKNFLKRCSEWTIFLKYDSWWNNYSLFIYCLFTEACNGNVLFKKKRKKEREKKNEYRDKKLKIGCNVHWWKIADGESRKNHCICKQYYANGHNRVQTIAYNLLSELITAMWLPFVIYQLNFFCFFFLHIFPPLLLSGNWMRVIFHVTNFLTVDNFLTRTNKVQVFNVWIEPIQFKGSVKLSNNYKKKLINILTMRTGCDFRHFH